MIKFNGKDILFSPQIHMSDYDTGYDAGQKNEYDRFWDAYQENGNRRLYAIAFFGSGWNDITFKPKYNIVIAQDSNSMFSNSAITNLAEILESQGVILDTTNAPKIDYIFDNCLALRHAPHVVFNNSSTGAFNWCLSLEKASIGVNENTTFSGTFNRCDNLTDFSVVGAIGKSIDLKHSPLSYDSLYSIIEALSETATGQTLTLKKSAVDTAFENGEGFADGSESSEWGDLISTKENWTISLV